ncbi:MAG TPA: hypothetical protein VKD91_15840 [Pyrinomonadaceae bacterium]|nr:hypothetical protein [Pyrinomonadaceae bacterium]
MTADEHNKTLGTLYFIYGAIHGLTLIGLVLLILVAWLTTPLAEALSAFWIVVGSLLIAVLMIVVGILPLVVGYGFRKRTRWVKPLGVTLAVLSLVNIPIGTALGIYTIKFFRSVAGVGLYGGRASSTSDSELKEAMSGAQPLMNLADRLK